MSWLPVPQAFIKPSGVPLPHSQLLRGFPAVLWSRSSFTHALPSCWPPQLPSRCPVETGSGVWCFSPLVLQASRGVSDLSSHLLLAAGCLGLPLRSRNPLGFDGEKVAEAQARRWVPRSENAVFTESGCSAEIGSSPGLPCDKALCEAEREKPAFLPDGCNLRPLPGRPPALRCFPARTEPRGDLL